MVLPGAAPTAAPARIGEPLKVVDEAYAGFDLVRFDGDQVYLLGPTSRRRWAGWCGSTSTAFPDTGRADLVDVVPEGDVGAASTCTPSATSCSRCTWSTHSPG